MNQTSSDECIMTFIYLIEVANPGLLEKYLILSNRNIAKIFSLSDNERRSTLTHFIKQASQNLNITIFQVISSYI